VSCGRKWRKPVSAHGKRRWLPYVVRADHLPRLSEKVSDLLGEVNAMRDAEEVHTSLEGCRKKKREAAGRLRCLLRGIRIRIRKKDCRVEKQEARDFPNKRGKAAHQLRAIPTGSFLSLNIWFKPQISRAAEFTWVARHGGNCRRREEQESFRIEFTGQASSRTVGIVFAGSRAFGLWRDGRGGTMGSREKADGGWRRWTGHIRKLIFPVVQCDSKDNELVFDAGRRGRQAAKYKCASWGQGNVI